MRVIVHGRIFSHGLLFFSTHITQFTTEGAEKSKEYMGEYQFHTFPSLWVYVLGFLRAPVSSMVKPFLTALGSYTKLFGKYTKEWDDAG
jgi:hypothetical protein